MANWDVAGATDSGERATITVTAGPGRIKISVKPPGDVTVSPEWIDRLRAALGQARVVALGDQSS